MSEQNQDNQEVPSLDGLLHTYFAPKRLVVFESGKTSATSTVLWIGGLGDGLNAVPYLPRLNTLLATLSSSDGTGWNLCQVLLTSSYEGWGSGTVERDAEEIERCCKYLRETARKRRIVVCGHSTGCQDIVALFSRFLNNEREPPPQLSLAGIILQAPVSDREIIEFQLSPSSLSASLSESNRLIMSRTPIEPIPQHFTEPFAGQTRVSAQRWKSLATTGPGTEDFFSSDLKDEELEKYFGRLSVKTLILLGEKDDAYSKHVDPEVLVKRMMKACRPTMASQLSGVIKGASHNLDVRKDGEETLDDFFRRVEGFLKNLS